MNRKGTVRVISKNSANFLWNAKRTILYDGTLEQTTIISSIFFPLTSVALPLLFLLLHLSRFRLLLL
jgi:hypothetical protein